MAKIICADDDPLINQLFHDILGRKGYQVRTCSSGEEVLQAFAQEPADLVLLDLLMPGKSGLETCRELRKRPDSFDVPILMVSAVDAETSIFDCLSSGADDYLLKPLHPTELLAKISNAFKKRSERLNRDVSLRPGSRFANRFDILRQIGAGGFSMVFHALDSSRNEDVALKVFDLAPTQRDDKTFISTFLREAYQLSRLDYPVIVKFHDFGQSGVFYYLVMEYVKGQSLEQFLQASGPLSEANAIVLGHEVAGAIRYLNLQRMVHRDIKPPNIMITESGGIKLLDFGLARSVSDSTTSVEDEIRVTPFFAPPELFVKGQTLDVKSDIYSLGATLYYGASKVLPFDGESVLAVIANHFNHAPPPLCETNPAVSKTFSQLIQQMLARQKEDRPDINEVIFRLRNMMATDTL